MFKTIIATCLLTFSCSSGSLKVENPKREYVPNVMIQGFYTFNNTFEVDYSEERSFSFGEEYNVSLYVHRTGAFGVQAVIPCSCDFTIHILQNSYGSLSFNYVTSYGYDDGSYNVLYEFDSAEFSIDNMIHYIEGHNDPRFQSSDLFVKDFMVYFPNAFVLSGDDLDLFRTFFNPYGNKYTIAYNGWYTYRTNWHDGDLMFELKNMSFMVNNQIFNSYTHKEDICYYSGYNLGDGSLITYDVWNEPNTYTVTRPIYMSGMFPYSVRNLMSVEGVFDYVQDSHETTWYEMILSVMDAPLYYLTSLFDFKMFGITMFVALSSLLTLLVIVTIIKKVV